MKNLNSILQTKNIPHFPIKGRNGYGGEQDGTTVLLAGFRGETRETAKKVMIPENAKLHWARYTNTWGWEGAVGIWSNDYTEEEMEKSDLKFE